MSPHKIQAVLLPHLANLNTPASAFDYKGVNASTDTLHKRNSPDYMLVVCGYQFR